MPGETTVTPLIVPEAAEVNVSGLSPEQTVWAPLMLPGKISLTFTVKVSILEQPEALINSTEITSPLDKVDIVVV